MDVEADKLRAERVRELLRASFSNKRCLTARKCATVMGLSVRSMQRRLSKTGLAFSAIVDEIRYDLAKEQLL